ncbi:MAG: succinate dehydrogenase cytochrome b subunit [Bdellovibrionales bacterium]|nr:succinate dehydrogenase cytochrome b subunit [Bdellovibrionales bacterium]
MTTTTLKRFLGSSITKKQVMSITGLSLCLFLVGHLIGNCLIYVGPEAFNTYGHTLITNPLIYVAEAGLAAMFLIHILLAMKLTMENKAARPINYYMKKSSGRGETFASNTMPYTGLIVLVFLVLHLLHFKFGPQYTVVHSGVEMRDLYKMVVEYFSHIGNVAWYIFAMIALGIHVSHGFWSAFQSFGINHQKYNCTLRCISKLYAVFITVGFAALPIYCYLQGAN